MSAFLIGIASWIYFLFFQSQGIFGGDSGDVVTAAAVMGVAHPPGYPLYTAIGWLLNQLPLQTPAWRLGLLSSIPHAATVALLYAITFRLTKNRLAGLFVVFTIISNYVFFLYSVTPEVFALLDFMFIATWYALIRWQETPKRLYIFIVSLLMGLSFSHHHMMVLMIPVIIYIFAQKFRVRDRIPVISLIVAGLFLGALWYLYVPVAAKNRPIIDWDHATTVSRLLQLITRQDYGTFQSSGSYGESMTERFIAVKAYIDFIRMDMGFTLFFCVLGMIHFWKKRRRLATAVVVALMLFGPVFFFYASFPLINRFTLATFERFMLPSYLLFSFLAGIGVAELFRYIRHRSIRYVAAMLLCIVTILLIQQQQKKFIGIRADQTADNFGKDMVSSLPQNAILLLSQDTALFITQYVRYALHYRPDTKIIHTSMMGSAEYRNTLESHFPNITGISDTDNSFTLGTFITYHATQSGVFTNAAFTLPDGWFWVPHGLLLQALPSRQLPSVDTMYRNNATLWATYHLPQSGILSRYKHMMLSDIANVYTNARIELANTLTKAGKHQEALREMDEAIAYDGDSSRIDAYLKRGVIRATLKDCHGALSDFRSSRDLAPYYQNDVYLYESVTYRLCIGDEVKADELLHLYNQGKKESESLLENL